MVAATEDSVTLRWNASTDNSGSILRVSRSGIYHPGNSTQKTITGLVPNYTQTVPRVRGRRDRQRVRAERAADGDDGAAT